MATQLFAGSRFLSKPQQALASLFSRSLSFFSAPASAPRFPLFLPSLLHHRLRPLSAASSEFRGRIAAASSGRSFTSRSISSSLNDPNLNCSNRLPKETIHPVGVGFKHWNVMIDKLEGDHTDDDIWDRCIKMLAPVVGSEEEARMNIFSLLVGHFYIIFRALLSEELSYKLLDLPTVKFVCPDLYLGQNVFDGKAAPCYPEYHEKWVRTNARANERKGRDDRSRNFHRSRYFERSRENMQNRDFQARGMLPMHNQGMQNPPLQGNMPPPNMGGGMPPPSNFGGMPPHDQVKHTVITSRAWSLHNPDSNWLSRHTEEAMFSFLMFPCSMYRYFKHWLVVMEDPEDDATRDEIIDSYIKTLAQMVGSEEEARAKIYSVNTGPYYYSFGALISAKLAINLDSLPRVQWAMPDSYLGVENNNNWDLSGETFLDGQAVPYDPEYHEEWVGNNARANERNGHDDRSRNFDRSRIFERRENMQNGDLQARDMPPMHNQGMQKPPPQGNMPPPIMGGGMPPLSNLGEMPLHNQDVLFIRNVRMYPYDELLVAAEGFGPDDKVGVGGFGSVYKGTLEDGTLVAIKVLST